MSATTLQRWPSGPVTSQAWMRSGRPRLRVPILIGLMATAVSTKTTELDGSRVRIDVEVESGALEREMETAAAAIGRDMRVPGFRSGKVPAQVVIRQVGREAVLDEAVRRALPGWYEDAIHEAGIATVGDPKIDLADLPEKGSPLAFSFEVGVVPPAQLGDYRGIEVGRREPTANPDEVEAELERMRESVASLETVDRAAADGDFVVMDFVGRIDGEEFAGGEARGHVAELGAGRLIPGFEEQLRGAGAGEQREVVVTFPEDYQADQLAGKDAVFTVDVKEVKEKQLPELDDDFAVEAGGYDSLDELRAEIEERIKQAAERAIEGEFREAAVDAVVATSAIEIPHELIHSKAHEMWHRTARRLAAQGVDPARYLEMAGKTEEELVVESEEDAETALKREAVLAAIVEAEGIEVNDDEVNEALRAAAPPDASEKQLKRALKRARSQGAEEALREDIAMRKAVDLIVDNAKPIPLEQAAAREALWTPDKDEEGTGSGKIWTPGS
jgi:trigger factor